jgi:hypothetical protein
MTGCPRARHLNRQPNRILIVVDPHLDDALHKARGRPLVPDRLPGSAEVVRLAGLDRKAQRLGVHPADHQNRAVARIGRHARHQPVHRKPRGQGVPYFHVLN